MMRKLQTCVLASLALVGSTVLAAAREPETHVLNVRLPDGGIEQIRYSGDVAPSVILPGSEINPSLSAFAAFDRVEAIMDEQMAGMMREAAMMATAMPDPTDVAPALSGATGACLQAVRIVSIDGGRPEMTTRTVGDCGTARPSPTAAPATRRAPGTLLVRNVTSVPDQGFEVASK